MPVSTEIKSQRLISLDALRGFTIAAMVIVNNPGSWQYVYKPLQHAEWHGITATDLIFPFFLFMVGVSIAFAYTKRLEAKVSKREMYKKIIWRSLKIFAVGIFLRLWPEFDFSDIRWVGVLPRIAIVFLIGGFIFLNLDGKKQIGLGVALLLGYWIVLAFIPVPIDDVIREALVSGTVMSAHGEIPIGEITKISDQFITANIEPGVNITAWADRLLVPGKFYQKTWDPEGLVSTIPAIVTAIIGMLVGRVILTVKDHYKKLTYLFFIGFSLLLVGELWSYGFPLNKNLWTSTFVLYTGGLATMGLAACILIIDIWGYTGWTRLGRVYGANAITAYVLGGMLRIVFYSDIIWGISLNHKFMEFSLTIGIEPKLASFIYAIIYMLLIYIPTYILYRKKIFIKL